MNSDTGTNTDNNADSNRGIDQRDTHRELVDTTALCELVSAWNAVAVREVDENGSLSIARQRISNTRHRQ